MAKAPAAAPDPITARLLAKQAQIEAAVKSLTDQLQGLNNQLYIIDAVLHPETDGDPPEEAAPQEDDGAGTI